MSKHANLPWKLRSDGVIEGPQDRRLPDGSTIRASIAKVNLHIDEGEANGAFIMRACHSHDDLVAALKRLMNFHAPRAAISGGVERDIMERSRDALAKAEPDPEEVKP